MKTVDCGRYTIGEHVTVIREKDGRVMSGKVEAMKTVNNRTLIIISYANRHASFYDDSVNPLPYGSEVC